MIHHDPANIRLLDAFSVDISVRTALLGNLRLLFEDDVGNSEETLHLPNVLTGD